ncbi:MAG: peptide chain release factor N(5)-glutamine methyltransferase [Candidatus Methylomirabilis oxyfera]|nr:peptide chain release factor N(5)-glutamine methyltransferase [Candidatus Methylomirabilis oxyfera]
MRGARCEVRGSEGAHPALSTPHGFTYHRAVERLERAGVESASLDAACLLEAASGIPRWRFVLEPERPIARGISGLFASMLSRREAREPIAYILGAKEFWSLSLAVSRDVLIPRPETETLVEAVLEKISSRCQVPSSAAQFQVPGSRFQVFYNLELETRNPELKILDVGTGCGAIALALAMEIPDGRICGLDRSRSALRIAGRNASALGLAGRIQFLGGDLFEPLRTRRAGGGFDLIVSNPPYIPSAALTLLAPEIAVYEPREALDGGPDGLHYHRRIIEEAPGYLRAGGWLALEVGDGQSAAVVELIRKSDAFGPAEVKKDLTGGDRVVLAWRRAVADG